MSRFLLFSLFLGLSPLLGACAGTNFVPRCLSQSDCPNLEPCDSSGRCVKKEFKEPHIPKDAGVEPSVPERKLADKTSPDLFVKDRDISKPDVQPEIETDRRIPEPPVDNNPGCGTLQSLAPSFAEAGTKLVVLLGGSQFAPTSTVLFGTTRLASKVLGAGTIEASLDLTNVAPGTYDITVECPGGKASSSLKFVVKPASHNGPQLDRLLPFVAYLEELPTNISYYGKNLSAGTRLEMTSQQKPALKISIGAAEIKWRSVTYGEFTLRPSLNLIVGKYDVVAIDPQGLRSKPFTFEISARQCPVTQKDTFKQAAVKVDILFVADDSCSMADEHAVLANGAATFFQKLQALSVDFQIGVTTTDVTNSRFPAGCFSGQTKIITNQTPNASSVFQKNIQVGTQGSAVEKGLAGMQSALSPARLNDPKCNQGFLRKDADLFVVFVTDEGDASSQPVTDYTNFLKTLKTPASRIHAAAILGPQSNCLSTGLSLYPRYTAVVNQFGGTLIEFCKDRLPLGKLNANMPSLQQTFSLTRLPDPSTIKVTVNGNSVSQGSNGWTYAASTNQITFALTAIPPANASIVIEYQRKSQVIDDFVQKAHNKVDFLLVIDDSGSMTQHQSLLANQATGFLLALRDWKLDFQIGVTTTDTTGRANPAGCLVGSTKIVRSGMPESTSLAALKSNIQVGTKGSAVEKGLEAAYEALSPARLNDPKCNQGFLRKDAVLSIVFLTDEDDASPKTVSDYVTFFKSLKGTGQPPLFASAIAGPPPTGCQGSFGNSVAGTRYWDLAAALNGVRRSICTMAGALADVGRNGLGQRERFVLKRQADAQKPISVYVDGKIVSSGWKYEASSNSIVFLLNSLPGAGAQVQIHYEASSCP